MYLKFSRLFSDFLLIAGILCCSVSIFSCRDDSDTTGLLTPEGEILSVSLTIDFSNEAGGYAPQTRGADDGQSDSFEAKPNAVSSTRSSGVLPTSLYNLEIRQYDQSGNYLNGQSLGNTTIGSKVIVPLTVSEDCQLMIVARGDGNTVGELGSRKLSAVQTDITATSTKIEGIDPTSEMKAMPYVLHLPHVKVVADAVNAGKGIIRSTENGTEDVRLLLKRLVARVTLNWSLSDAMKTQGYELKEVKLCQVPKQYYLFPAGENTEWGTTYPSTVSEFVDVYRLTGTDLTSANGSKSVWIPANVRGTSSAATAPIHRTKANAPTAASYAEIVVDNTVKKERLYYRAYLGGNDPTDFNLNENTDYNWTLNIKSADYTGDPRIELLDQTPVQSENLVPTANCLMLQPGGNLCFNPYQHTAGTNGWNDYLVNNPGTSSPSAKTAITSVKVLWQTKDAGTSGNLVLGYIIDDTHHENLANITNPADLTNARVHVKAPVTQGGNAVIAAYNGTTILWSWHIWITDYVPARINSYAEYATAQKSTKNGTVHKYDSPMFAAGGVYEKMVMMDRDLGARKGGFPGFTLGTDFTTQDVTNTYGLIYQWGRKDPFFPSADGTTNEKDIIYDGYGVAISMDRARGPVSISTAIQHPNTFYHTSTEWCTPVDGKRWNKGTTGYAPGIKTIYDPCPYGWKIPMIFANSNSTTATNIDQNSIFAYFGRLTDGTSAYNNNSSKKQYSKFLFYNNGTWVGSVTIADNTNPKGGRLFLTGSTIIADADVYNSVWIPANVERNPAGGKQGGFSYAGRYGHMWCADWFNNLGGYLGYYDYLVQVDSYSPGYGWPVRCIQE